MLWKSLGIACFALPCSAQSATVRVSHDHAGATVVPGESLRIVATVSWQGALQWAGLKGDLLASGDLGQAANVGSEVMPGIFVTLGAPAGGSVKGFDVASAPVSYFGPGFPPVPFANATGVEFLWFDWTAPPVTEPTEITFNFAADPIAPNVRLYPNPVLSPAFIEAPTTYIGTSILVIPAPVGLPILALAALAPRRRR
ncbi:MAG: hypothetical protein R3B68_07800 [Phycisphaerales bacterium]